MSEHEPEMEKRADGRDYLGQGESGVTPLKPGLVPQPAAPAQPAPILKKPTRP